MTVLRIFDDREPHLNELPPDDPFVITMSQPMSERTKAKLQAIDDNIRAAWQARYMLIGGK